MIQRRWPGARRPLGRPWEAYLLWVGRGGETTSATPAHFHGGRPGGGSCCRKTPPHPGPFRREPRDPARVNGVPGGEPNPSTQIWVAGVAQGNGACYRNAAALGRFTGPWDPA